MNIVLYGVPDSVTERIAEKYGLNQISTVEEIGGEGTILSVSPMKDPRQLLALYEEMAMQEDKIDAVIVCGFEPCEVASTVQYCAPPGKLFTLHTDAGEETLEDELSRILDTLSGRICAHEGI